MRGMNKQNVVRGSSTLGLGQFGAPVFGQGTPGFVPAAPLTAPAASDGRADQKAPADETVSRPRSPGTLSLAFEIPKEGQMLVFTKAGGDPKLTVELRPRQSLQLLLGALWMLPWFFLLLLALILFGRDRYAPTARRQLPVALIVVGLLLFVFLPTPAFWLGLALIGVGTVQASVARHRQTASR